MVFLSAAAAVLVRWLCFGVFLYKGVRAFVVLCVVFFLMLTLVVSTGCTIQ